MILLLGGTIDSREIAKELTKNRISFITTTVSDYGRYLAEKVSAQVMMEELDEEGFRNIINEKKISLLVDATHPFARNISENAINAANLHSIPYYRYERPGISFKDMPHNIFLAEDLDEAQRIALEEGERILLTTGSRGLKHFRELVDKKVVFARVLPESTSIESCLEAGIRTGNIIAMQGPFSREFNQLLIKEKNIDLLITKESGDAGGMQEKIDAAIDLNIKTIVIQKPKLQYPVVFTNIEDLIKKIMEV